jgi:multidrug efflux pump subunit AcrB
MKPASERAPIQVAAAQLMGKLATIPGVFAFLRPYPVLEISTGAVSQTQGQYSYSISGVNAEQVYETSSKLVAKLYEFPGFLSLSTDRFDHTPALDVDILRDQARMYGVSETRILELLRTAYSQNYLYLIKKPTDQYQVILEVQDKSREHPEDLGLLYMKSDDGKELVPLSALTEWKPSLGRSR